MMGPDSIVIRVNPDQSFTLFEGLPTMLLDRPLQQSLGNGFGAAHDPRFEMACREAIKSRSSRSFRPDLSSSDEIVINPILDDNGLAVRYLVCWTRHSSVRGASTADRPWSELTLDAVVTRYRVRSDERSEVVEASPWWAVGDGAPIELWPHHTQVSAMGLGHEVIEATILDATEAAAEFDGAAAVRIEVPSAEMLSGLVPVVHGAVRASALAPERLLLAIAVDLAVDPDLLPIIVHLRTMSVRIDIVGLDALTSTLHMVSDTSHQAAAPIPAYRIDHGPWSSTFATATQTIAA
jgi:hypothetical protein